MQCTLRLYTDSIQRNERNYKENVLKSRNYETEQWNKRLESVNLISYSSTRSKQRPSLTATSIRSKKLEQQDDNFIVKINPSYHYPSFPLRPIKTTPRRVEEKVVVPKLQKNITPSLSASIMSVPLPTGVSGYPMSPVTSKDFHPARVYSSRTIFFDKQATF